MASVEVMALRKLARLAQKRTYTRTRTRTYTARERRTRNIVNILLFHFVAQRSCGCVCVDEKVFGCLNQWKISQTKTMNNGSQSIRNKSETQINVPNTRKDNK